MTRLLLANMLLLFAFATTQAQVSANFTASSVYPCAGETINFTNLSTGANNYIWLENGVPFSTSASPSRPYPSVGSFLVTLIATDGTNNDTTNTIIQVNPGLGATLSAQDASCFGFSDGSIDLTPSGGTPNLSLCLDGINDFVGADSVSTNNFSGGITVEGWVKPELTWTSGDGMIAAFNSVGGGNHFLFSYNTSIQKFIYFDNTVGNQIPVATHARGQWHHVAVTITGSNQGRIYVNGVLVRQFVTGSGWVPNGGQFSMGQEWDGPNTSQHFNGCMDEVRVWTTALTQATIQDNFNNSCASISPTHPNINSLVAYYSFNEGTGTFTFDRSGNNNHGTFNGILWGLPAGNDYGCFSQGTGYAYDWSNSAVTEDLTGLTAGTYVATVTDGAGCKVVDSANVNEPPQIVFSLSASPSDTICIGDTTDILTSGVYTFFYSPGGSLSDTTGGTVQAFPDSTTTYQVIAEDGNACRDTGAFTIVVNPLPIPAISGTDTICAGDSTTLTASGGTTYLWNTGDGNAAISVSPPADSTYSVLVTDANGCMASTSQTVTVNALPNASISGPSAICIGDSVTLMASGGGTYLWSTADTSSSISVNPGSTTSYGVLVTDANSCTDVDTLVLTVNPLPTISISGDAVICEGDTANLDASGGASYVWSTTATTASISVTPSSATSYSVVGTDSNSCVSSDTFMVMVNALPSIVVGGQDTLCEGDTTMLMASGAASYVWDTGDSTDVIQVNPANTTTYTVTGTDTNGCSASEAYGVFVYAAPMVIIAGDSSICEGESTSLEANGASTYVWSTTETTPNITVMPSVTTVYTVTGTDVNGCQGSSSVTVTVNANPMPVITDMNGVLSTDPGYASYQWYYEGNPIAGANVSDYNPSPSMSGTYTVVVTDSNGCTGTSTGVVGVETFSFLNSTTLYPNPNNGQFSLEIQVDRSRELKVTVTTLHGQRIHAFEDRANPGRWNRSIDLGEVAKGLYLVEIESGGSRLVRKVVVD